MKRKRLISAVMFLLCGLQLNAHAQDPATDFALGIPFRLEDLSGQVEGIRNEQQTLKNSLDSFNKTLGALQDVCYAPPICKKICEDGVQKIYFTEVDDRGIAVCPSEPAVAVPCYPYQCKDNAECNDLCVSNDDCRPGYACCTSTDAGCEVDPFAHCVPDVLRCGYHPGTTGGGTDFLRSPDGITEVDCAPYACDGSSCLTHCTSPADCRPWYWCDAAGKCVPESCYTSDDCPAGLVCIFSYCVLPE